MCLPGKKTIFMKFISYLSLNYYNKHCFSCFFLNFVHNRLNENSFEIILKNSSIEQIFNFKCTDLFESHLEKLIELNTSDF